MKRGDIIIMCICLAVAGVLALPRVFASPAAKVTVTAQGMAAGAYPLTQDRLFAVNDVTIEIKGGRARVRSSPCRDQICVHAGWLSRPGDAALCLPQRVALQVGGTREAGVDSLAY